MPARAQTPAGRATDWAVVLEFTAETPPALALVDVEELVRALAAYAASALHNPDRYAIQVRVRARGPQAALQSACDAHDRHVRALELPVWPLVRAEVLTAAELEQSWAAHLPEPAPAEPAAWEYSPSVAEKVLSCERRLLRCTEPAQLRDTLADFVRRSGGGLRQGAPPDTSTLAFDLSLGQGPPLYATAEPFSVSRLVLDEALPALVEDARRLMALLDTGRSGAVTRP